MTTTPKSGAGVSRYLRLYRVLSQALAEGRFAAPATFPSEPRLAMEYGVSRSTVRRALQQLQAEGRIERRRGSGTFARDQGRGSAASKDLSALLDPLMNPPPGVTCRTIALQQISTPAFLLGEGSGFGATALLVRQIRCVQGEPMALETAYVPEETGKELTRQRPDVDHGAILTVLAALSQRGVSLEREFAALEADPLAADSLGLTVGAPLFNVRTLARDPRHHTLAYLDCLYRPDRYEAHTEMAIGKSKGHHAKKRN
ncbi:MAG TPA: GntR family transcriptional regulator [Steroidobacteraceae bacterium]|jgi:GntR family transcriptional regulator|nr:GntR family transcriptional regulator [Steroidobacteraceae bacterium]